MSETNGIIIRLNPYRDADYISVILTENFGKITCLARSARKSKHRFFSNLQVFDSGKFLISEKIGRRSIESISNINSSNDISKRSSNFLLACTFAEATDLLIPEDDPEYANLIKPLVTALNNLKKTKNANEQLLVAAWFFVKLALITGIDPRGSKGFFRKDDLEWLSHLAEDKMLCYEPIEASTRAFLNLLNFIEKTFQVNFKVISQLKFPWTY